MTGRLSVLALGAALASAACIVKPAEPPPAPPPPPAGQEQVAAQPAQPAAESAPAEEPVAAQPAPAPQPAAPARPNEHVAAHRAEPPAPPPPPAPPAPPSHPVASGQPNHHVHAHRAQRPFEIEPTAGPPRTVVTIYGDFHAARRPQDLKVQFNGARKVSRPKTIAADAITVVVPPRATTGAVQVTFRRRVLWTGQFSVTGTDNGLLVPTEGGSGLLGSVYQLAPNTRLLPDFSTLGRPYATIVVPALKVAPRKFDAGFPGLGKGGNKLLEWFAIRFEGQLMVPAAGSYAFRLNSDDGSRLYIDGQLVIDNNGVHPPKAVEGRAQLAAGAHAIVVEYFQGPRYQIALQLMWKRPGQRKFKPVQPKFFKR